MNRSQLDASILVVWNIPVDMPTKFLCFHDIKASLLPFSDLRKL